MKLRPKQSSLLGDLRQTVRSGSRRPLVVAHCGFGKTILMADLIRSARERSNPTLVLAPRRVLIYQTAEKLGSVGLDYGIIMSGERRRPSEPVQVASVPTLYRRHQEGRMQLPPAKVILIDESHCQMGKATLGLLSCYPDAFVVGFTATPARSDGRGLGEVYDSMVEGPSIPESIADGHLVPLRYFGGDKPDLSGVKVQGGDYVQSELGDRVDQPKLIGDIVSNWARIASDRQTVVFAVNVAHSRHLCDEFRSVGVAAEHIDGDTPNEERRGIQARLESGETQVLCSCEVVSYGWDCPVVSCGVFASPTKSIARYIQKAGRLLRTHPGKEDAILIDHAGVVSELGFVDEDIPWSLDGNGKIQDRIESERKKPEPITCDACGTTFRPAPECPECGHEMAGKASKAIETHEAELQEINRKTKQKMNREWTAADKRRFYGELQTIARERGYKPGWAAAQYRNRFDVWPNAHKDQGPIPPTTETRSWVKSQMIRYAKRREKAA